MRWPVIASVVRRSVAGAVKLLVGAALVDGRGGPCGRPRAPTRDAPTDESEKKGGTIPLATRRTPLGLAADAKFGALGGSSVELDNWLRVLASVHGVQDILTVIMLIWMLWISRAIFDIREQLGRLSGELDVIRNNRKVVLGG